MHGSKCELLRCAAIGPHPPQGSLGKLEVGNPPSIPRKADRICRDSAEKADELTRPRIPPHQFSRFLATDDKEALTVRTRQGRRIIQRTVGQLHGTAMPRTAERAPISRGPYVAPSVLGEGKHIVLPIRRPIAQETSRAPTWEQLVEVRDVRRNLPKRIQLALGIRSFEPQNFPVGGPSWTGGLYSKVGRECGDPMRTGAIGIDNVDALFSVVCDRSSIGRPGCAMRKHVTDAPR